MRMWLKGRKKRKLGGLEIPPMGPLACVQDCWGNALVENRQKMWHKHLREVNRNCFNGKYNSQSIVLIMRQLVDKKLLPVWLLKRQTGDTSLNQLARYGVCWCTDDSHFQRQITPTEFRPTAAISGGASSSRWCGRRCAVATAVLHAITVILLIPR